MIGSRRDWLEDKSTDLISGGGDKNPWGLTKFYGGAIAFLSLCFSGFRPPEVDQACLGRGEYNVQQLGKEALRVLPTGSVCAVGRLGLGLE